MPTLSAAARRELLPLLKDILEKGMCVGMETRIENALARYSKKRKPIPQRKKDKAARKISLGAETAAVREEVFKRAGGEACEFCGDPAAEMHHLEGGSGRRREKQAVSNCVAVCLLCHREYHHRPEDFRDVVAEWAKRYGYPMPSRFLTAPLASTSAPKEPPKQFRGTP